MKKSVLIMLSVLLMTAILISACNNTDTSSETSMSSSKASDDDDTNFETLPQYYDYSFDSYDDFQRALKTQDSYEYTDIRYKLTESPEAYQKLLSAFENNDIQIAVPQFNGKDIEFRNRDEYSNITLFCSEMYRLPWVWYHCVVDNYQLRIQVAYLSIIDEVVIKPESSITEILSIIWPDTPLPDNYTKFDSYSSVYEKDIILADGTTVKALVMELKDDQADRENIYVKLHYKGMIITVYADAKLLTDSFWSSFGFDFR